MRLGKLVVEAARHALRRQTKAREDDLAALDARLRAALQGGAAEEARTICARILEQAPEHPGALWALAVLTLQAGDAEGAVPYFSRFDALESGGRVTTRRYRSALMDAGRYARGEPYVGWREDVLLETNHCAIFEGDEVYFRETQDRTFANHPWVRGRVAPDGADFVVSLPPADRVVAEPFILLGTDENFSHWLERNLLKLAVLEACGFDDTLPLLINDDLRGYQLEYLRLVGVPPERLMPVPRGLVVSCRKVAVPVCLRNRPRMRLGIDWLRARVAEHMSPAADASDLLFVSRRDSTLRVMHNEADLEQALKPLGFTTFVAGEAPVTEQIRAFSRARVIVGAHGAGLTNLIFAPPGAFVLEIATPGSLNMEEFRFIAGAMGQPMVTLVADRPGDNARPDVIPLKWNFYADVEQVLATLREHVPELFARR
ncbi:MAG TPA: glycosyltransferase family 61 protein [Burkholderiales bacterium]|nr:glycosyltransferase family 61 protein [Burkholderiales bacterium]